ncbi:MAG: alpha-glucosidase C-terminal domain-containing protein, partial [Candidatus Verstraetearchaeota archaeon]|nr:alpha-glucosidase C-terminal domain-containing protein [Candidatus Verstraetearchaeota archaeon]
QASLFWWMKRAINIRKHFKAFGRGSIEFLYPENSRILAFVRKYREEELLVVANLSKRPQVAELDLSAYEDRTPREVFGNVQFPRIGKSNYVLTFDPYGYYVFSLAEQEAKSILTKMELMVKTPSELVSPRIFEKLESDILPSFLMEQNWFLGRERDIDRVKIRDLITFANVEGGYLGTAIIDVFYMVGIPESYILPIAYVEDLGERSRISEESPHAVISKVNAKPREAILCDATATESFPMLFLSMLTKGTVMKGKSGELTAAVKDKSRAVREIRSGAADAKVLRTNQHNTSIIFGDRILVKIYRKIEEGPSPEIEMLEFLNCRGFRYAPNLLGKVAYRERGTEEVIIASLQEFIPNEGDCWNLFSKELDVYFKRVSYLRPDSVNLDFGSIFEEGGIPPEMIELIGRNVLEKVALLSKRTADLHNTLFSGKNPEFAPERFNYLYQFALYQGLTSYVKRILRWPKMKFLTGEEKRLFQRVCDLQDEIEARLRRLRLGKINASRGRIHGDYNLEQVLFTGSDFFIIDFEGQPRRAQSERRIKKSTLVDVAGMIRSLHYVAHDALESGWFREGNRMDWLEGWANAWYLCCSRTFLWNYVSEVQTGIIPEDKTDLRTLLEAFVLEKAFQELEYEINHRPHKVKIPLKGILEIMESGG